MVDVGNIKKNEMFRFLLVGLTSFAIDFMTYFSFLFFEVEYSIAKGVSFVFGALFGYYANRSFTFQSSKRGPKTFFLFSLLYLITFIANVGVNKIMVQVLQDYQFNFFIAFIAATAVSTGLNFIGMKRIVFTN